MNNDTGQTANNWTCRILGRKFMQFAKGCKCLGGILTLQAVGFSEIKENSQRITWCRIQ